jgi:hypothetical protein
VNHKRVAIIGGGIAGIAAARRLAAAHGVPMIFEKARRPGGRVSTRRAGAFSFDHGAQYFTCRDAGFEGVVSDCCRRGVAALWDAPILTLANGVRGESRGAPDRFVGAPA